MAYSRHLTSYPQILDISMAFPLKSATRAVLAFAFLASLAACGTDAPLTTSDGRNTSQVQCPADGPADTCEQNATGLCGGPFDKIGSSVDNNKRTLIFACQAKPQ
jgi:predicted small lipoprotein YifL